MTWTPHVSATAIDTFRECQRKLAFRWHDKRENLSAFRGKCGHSILEAYGKDKTPPEIHAENLAKKLAEKFADELAEKGISAEDYAARVITTVNKMIPHLPDPPWPSTEEAIAFELDGVNFVGRIDLQPDASTILDHKFTGSPDFIKKPEDLLTDAQATIYAYWKFREADALGPVRLRWLYGVVGAKPRAKLVEQAVLYEHVRDQMVPLIEVGREIVRLRLLNPDPLSLEPTWSSCEKFGGCPYQDKCQPTAEQLTEAYFGKDDRKMGVISNLKNKKTETKTPERTDDGHAKADAAKMAGTLLDVGMDRADVVKSIQKKFVGLPLDVIEALVPKPQAVNPPDSPPEDEKVEEPKGKKGKASKSDEPGPPPLEVMIKGVISTADMMGLKATVSIALK